MRFISTEGRAPEADLPTALFRGLAPDGGLYMPRGLPSLSRQEVKGIRGQPWSRVALEAARRLLGQDLEDPGLEKVVKEALDFPVPLVPLRENLHVLELFHGPTLAFKDVGARFMARLMAHFRDTDQGPLTVLTATSGDTGGAVAQAFQGLSGIRVVILFPDGKVTPRQERQFSTLGGNVTAVAVQGDFDDCQRLAKGAFRDPGLGDEMALTSANSINVGRLLPQSFYYFLAWAQNPTPLLFSVPSGNFGNLTAGLMAGAMGLPEVKFLAATNANDEFPEMLRTGVFTPRPSRKTLSTAMDVGDPSNLARILHLYRDDLDALRRDVSARSVSDAETRTCIRRVRDETGHVLDPHTAVGYVALEEALEGMPERTGILLATAHPSKFAEVVEPVLGTELPFPARLARCLEKERKVTPLEPEQDALHALLRGLETV